MPKADNRLNCFKPLKAKKPKILILGTMPGNASLESNEYYAYKHNAFWKIMFELLETQFSEKYEEKKKLVLNNNIALWDTISSCLRVGSSDTAIKDVQYNDINGFLIKNKDIKAVFLNGQLAAKLFYKSGITFSKIKVFIMPSTSPANTIKYEQKLKQWARIKEFI